MKVSIRHRRSRLVLLVVGVVLFRWIAGYRPRRQYYDGYTWLVFRIGRLNRWIHVCAEIQSHDQAFKASPGKWPLREWGWINEPRLRIRRGLQPWRNASVDSNEEEAD